MWTEPVRGPDALHRRDTEPHSLRHRPCCPVGRLVRRRRLRQPDHLGGLAGGDRRLARRPGLVAQQARDTRLGKPFLPAPNGCLRLACGGHDGLRKQLLFWLTSDDYAKMLEFQKRNGLKSQSDVIATALHRLWKTEGLV